MKKVCRECAVPHDDALQLGLAAFKLTEYSAVVVYNLVTTDLRGNVTDLLECAAQKKVLMPPPRAAAADVGFFGAFTPSPLVAAEASKVTNAAGYTHLASYFYTEDGLKRPDLDSALVPHKVDRCSFDRMNGDDAGCRTARSLSACNSAGPPVNVHLAHHGADLCPRTKLTGYT